MNLRLFHRLAALFRRPSLDRDLDSEMAAHLDLAIEENLNAGMSPQEARRRALIQFGGTQQALENHREARSLPMIETLAQDLRYTFRALRKDRGFAAVAILILALGIGANIVVFSVVNTILLRPLPFAHSDRVAWLSGNEGKGGLSMVTYRVDSFEEYQRHNKSFESLTSYIAFLDFSDYKLTNLGEPRIINGIAVAGNFFQTLGVQPMLGRLFTPNEYAKGGPPAVLLSNAFWRNQFAGDPNVVGRALTMNGRDFTIIGVMPASFDFGAVFAPGTRQDVFTAAIMDDIRNYGHMLSVVGLLKPGVTPAQAQAEADILYPQLRKDNPSWSSDIHTKVSYLKDYVSGKLRRSLFVLWAAVALILLIVCVNLSNLLLARMASRSKEYAMRTALGASRGRLIGQLLTESLVLSVFGAVLGVVFAFGATSYLAHQGSIALPLLNTIRVDGPALLWTLLITFVVGILFGIAPGLAVSGANPQDTLKDAGRGFSEGRGRGRLRSVLVVSEVALACVLLVGSGLLLRSFLQILDIDLGFQPTNAYAIKVDYNDGGDSEKRAAILQEVIARAGSIPGVESAGISDMLPLDRDRSWGLWARGAVFAPDDFPDAFIRIVSPGYLQAMGMHLVAGRDFTWKDSAKALPVIIINETAARRHWPGQDPIGRIAQGIGDKDTTVIGIVADVRQTSLEGATSPEAFAPITQQYPSGCELVLRSKLPPDVLGAEVLAALRQLNPGQVAAAVRPLQRLVDHSVSPRRFFVYLVAIFATLGLILAALGIYGVISYSVTRQTQEIGIRMALGATPRIVQRSVLARTLRLALFGIAAGTVASFAASKVIASLLFKTDSTDPITFRAVAVLLVLVALLAGYFPALRATHIDPVTALRCD
jgi:predicted permease